MRQSRSQMNVYLKHSLKRSIAAVLAAAVLAALASCARTSEEAALAGAMDALAAAAEEGELGVLRDHLASDFLGNERLDRRAVQQIMLYHRRQYRQVKVQIIEREIYVEGERAQTTVLALLLGFETLPTEGRLMHIEARWRKHDGLWQVQRAQWRNAVQSD